MSRQAGDSPERTPESGDSSDPFSVRMPEGSSPTASLEAVGPVAVFLALNYFLDLGWAIIGATIASLATLIRRYRSGVPMGKFLPAVMLLIVGRAIIGYLTDSSDVYFGLGIGAKYVIAAGLLASVAIKRNVVAKLAPYAFGFSPAVTSTDSYQSATAHITVIGALYYCAGATFDIWLLNGSSLNQYLLVRTGVNWVASTVILIGCAVYLARRLSEIDGFPGLMPIFEQRVEQQAAAMGWDISDPDGSVSRIPKDQRHNASAQGPLASLTDLPLAEPPPDGDAETP